MDRTLIASNLGLGTHYVILSNQPPDTIQIPTDLLSFHGEIIQVVVTSKSNYLGYLEELLNVPFVLPPRNCQLIGHQSDNRLAVDCAELAVYGMRRMGYSVPYAGPHRITDWLVQTDTLKAGTIIHFGHQVSVLYEDNGVIGKLDPDDLLIHAYKQKAEVISFGYTDLQSSSYLFYAWDWGKLNKNLNNK
ncbi:MAG: hypothetical protein ACKVOR_13440 [Flavobacteriales bacterium]